MPTVGGEDQGFYIGIHQLYPATFGWYLVSGPTGSINLLPSSVTLDQWQHVVVRGNGATTPNIYVDGVKYGTGGQAPASSGALVTYPAQLSSWPLYLGRLANYTGFEWGGGLSHVAIWDSALTDAQISDLYTGGTNRCR